MSGKKGLFVLVAVLVILVLVAGLQLTGVVHALPPAQEPTQADITIPYPGRLADDAGLDVADGAYDFTFALYDAATGGTLLWSEAQEGVVVKEGAFVVSLGSVSPLSAALLEGGERWLEVAVRGPEEVAFTALAPRQRLSAAAPALAASINQAAPCPHDHWGESWSGASAGLTLSDTSGNTAMIPGVLAGVFGDSTSWGGVWGRSQDNIGVLGESTNYAGVYGSSTNGWGVYAVGAGDGSGTDVLGDLRLDGTRGEVFAFGDYLNFYSNGNINFDLDNDNDSSNQFRIWNGGEVEVLVIDEAGNLWVPGQLQAGGGKPAVVDTEHYGTRKLYAMESPELWFEDFGTAALVDGEATVAFEPIFAETVNLEEDYHVFLIPLSQEPVLLFVTAKTSTSFTVQGVTLDGRPAACSFDYRVVAKRLGYEDVRLDEMIWPMEEEKR